MDRVVPERWLAKLANRPGASHQRIFEILGVRVGHNRGWARRVAAEPLPEATFANLLAYAHSVGHYLPGFPRPPSKRSAKRAARAKLPKPAPQPQQPLQRKPEFWFMDAAFVASPQFLLTPEWRRLRMQALKRCGARCQCCGASPQDGETILNVDHIKPRARFPKLALELSNLQVLCGPCNHGKGNWDETDWRPR